MHPIVAQMNASPEQEPAILERGRNIVVTAGAGTGKTRTLVGRYLSLLAEGLDLRSIVAITFTRKAAREMRNRVRDEIRRYVSQPGLEKEEQERWQELYTRLDAARIDTIHSLCTEILRSHPAEAGVDPRFEVLEEGRSKLLQSRAVDEALAWAADDPQAAGLFALLGEDDLQQTLAALLEKRLDTREALARLPDDVLGHWQGVLDGMQLNRLDEDLAQAMPALHNTLRVALQRLEAFKSERQALDFDDLEGRALQLLQENETVRSYWRGAVKAILMDEFQDTNQRQRDLVTLLDDGQKLFIVGDAKQSIYRFRGADVVVFRRERERIEREGGLHLPLRTSYRAHKDLVQGLNDLLHPVLGEQAGSEQPWVEPFSRLEYYRKEPAPGIHGPHIELQLALGTKKGGALDRAAQALAARIAGLVASGAVGYGDIAILCRASGSFPAYEDALEQAGIPYLTVAGRGFYDRPEIRDLLNALHALADPTDDLALAGLMRSPALGLSDADLFRLCQARPRDAGTPLWEIMQKEQPGSHPWAEDGLRAGRAVRLIDRLHRKVGRTSVADVLKAFLDETQYRAALIEIHDARSVRNVDKLLADAHTSGIVGVGEFLEYVDGLKVSRAREGEARATAEGAVQIMSVHQAKGLEFPLVAVGDITHRQPGSDAFLIDPDLGIVLKLKDRPVAANGGPVAAGKRKAEPLKPAVWELASQRAGAQEQAESNRLFYVAATRAREKLILNGYVDLKQDGTVGACTGWLGTIAGADALCLQGRKIHYGPAGAGPLPLALRLGQTQVPCTLYEPIPCAPGPARVPGAAAEQAATVPPPLLDPLFAPAEQRDGGIEQQDRVPAQRVWRVVPAGERPHAPAWVVGSLVHEALAAWRFPDEQAPTGPAHDFDRWAAARSRGYGVADSRQLNNAIRRSRELLLRFREHPLFQEMNGAAKLVHEVPYSLEVDGRTESGIIDALYLRDGRWTIVEFKTDELRDQADLDRLLAEEDYRTQAERYRRAAERLLGQTPQLVLCLLNYERSVRRYALDREGDE